MLHLLRRKRNNGYTVSMYRTPEGYRVTLSDATDPTHREFWEGRDLVQANKFAETCWDTARDTWETDPWPTVNS